MWQPTRPDVAPVAQPRFLPTLIGIVVALVPLGLIPLMQLDPLSTAPDVRVALLLLAFVYPGWVAATAVRSRSVGPVILVAALVPAAALAVDIVSQQRGSTDVATDLDAFLAIALPPAIVGAVGYGLVELAVAVIQRLDPAGGSGTARSVLAALAGLIVAGALVGIIAWLAFGVVGFRI